MTPGDDDDVVAVEAAAVRLLAVREHSRYELERKLRGRGHGAVVIAGVLDELRHRGLLSDERFVEGYLRQRARKGYGPLRIRAELAERGAPSDLVDQGMQAAGVDWQRVLSDVAARRYGDAGEVDRAALARRGRQLQQRGFPVGMVRRYLDGLRLVS